MTWAIFPTPEDAMEIVAGFSEAGLTGGERNRIRPYAQAFLAGWNANTPVPEEHPCYLTDGPWLYDGVRQQPVLDSEGNPVPNPNPMRLVVVSHGTKAGWLAEIDRLLSRTQRDREILRVYRTFIGSSPWYAVDPWEPAVPLAQFFAGTTCT